MPVIVTESGAKTEVPTSAVVQDPWTLTEGVRIWKYLDYDSEEPLLKVTIVRFKKTGSTSIGLSSSHMIGPYQSYFFMTFKLIPRTSRQVMAM